MERKQFTFYESFAKALKRIKKDSDRAKAYDAICAYALYGEIPDLEKLPDAAALAFELIRPTLDSSARKASNGKAGGKQTASKTEANGKQTASEKEKEKEGEIEKEIENECSTKENTKEREIVENPSDGFTGRPRLVLKAALLQDAYRAAREEAYGQDVT